MSRRILPSLPTGLTGIRDMPARGGAAAGDPASEAEPRKSSCRLGELLPLDGRPGGWDALPEAGGVPLGT